MEKVMKSVSDLGVSAYVKMNGFKCVGKRSRNWYFEMNDDEVNEFEQLRIEYLNSAFHKFDHEIMAMKKMADYLPD